MPNARLQEEISAKRSADLERAPMGKFINVCAGASNRRPALDCSRLVDHGQLD